jgi:hypothetical protein
MEWLRSGVHLREEHPSVKCNGYEFRLSSTQIDNPSRVALARPANA